MNSKFSINFLSKFLSISHKNLFCVPTYSCQILIPTLNFISFQDGNELGTIMLTQGQSYNQSNFQSIRSLVMNSLTDLVVHFLILIIFACMPAVTYPSHTLHVKLLKGIQTTRLITARFPDQPWTPGRASI